MGALLDAVLDDRKITEDVIAEELTEICESVHSSCDDGCPVYFYNNANVPKKDGKHNCACFKNGDRMLAFIRKRRAEIIKEYSTIADWEEVRHFLKES